MGTNYYAVRTTPTTWESEWRIHIGKSSAGWMFLFHDKEQLCLMADEIGKMVKELRSIKKWLLEIKDRKTEPQTNKDFEVTYTCSFTDCDNFKNFGFSEKCIECKRKQSEAKYKTEQTEREGK